MTGFILFIVALILFAMFAVFGMLAGLLTYSAKDREKYFLSMAVAIDQAGNVWMAPLFNLILIKKGYRFGDPDQTISYVIGRNHLDGTLTWTGRMIRKTLDAIDENHSLKAVQKQEGGNSVHIDE